MVRLSGAVACGSVHFSESRAAAGSEQTWNPKSKRDFIAQKTCDGEPFLRSGTAKNAVPPVEMTNLLWFSGKSTVRFAAITLFAGSSSRARRRARSASAHPSVHRGSSLRGGCFAIQNGAEQHSLK